MLSPPSIRIALHDVACAETLLRMLCAMGYDAALMNAANTTSDTDAPSSSQCVFIISDASHADSTLPEQHHLAVLLCDDIAPETAPHNDDASTAPIRLKMPCTLAAIYQALRTFEDLWSARGTQPTSLFPDSENDNPWVFHPHKRAILDETGHTIATFTEKEAAIFGYLLAHRTRAVTSSALMEAIWHNAGEQNAHRLNTHIYRLRKFCAEHLRGRVEIANVDAGYHMMFPDAPHCAPSNIE